MVKTDPEGNMQWTNTYGKIGTTNYAYSIIQTDDLGYALGGYTADGGWAFRLLKIDALGNEQWNGIYNIPRTPSASEMCARAVQTSDGGFAIAGTTVRDRLYGEFLLIKTDENGVVPEFPSLLVLPICIIVTILVVYITKKYLPKKLSYVETTPRPNPKATSKG
jgi:hypothetical protein